MASDRLASRACRATDRNPSSTASLWTSSGRLSVSRTSWSSITTPSGRRVNPDRRRHIISRGVGKERPSRSEKARARVSRRSAPAGRSPDATAAAAAPARTSPNNRPATAGIGVMAQDRVAAFREGVVVAMPLQLEQQQVGQRESEFQECRCVRAFVTAIGQPRRRSQSVVLDVVDDFQRAGGEHALREEERSPDGPSQA